MLKRPGNQPDLGRRILDTLHRERLAAAGLTVGEDGAIVATEKTCRKITHLVVDNNNVSLLL